MNALTVFHFRFTAPLHIGTARADYAISGKRFHSDSLYGAILSAWNLMGISHPALIDGPDVDVACPDLGFTLTSLFPFYQENDYNAPLYFFPKPLGALKMPKDPNFQKVVKKIEFLELEEYLRLLSGAGIDVEAENEKIRGAFFSGQKLDTGFMDSEVYPRVRVPRSRGEDSEVYYIDRIFFRGESGLFCLAQFENETIEAKVKAALLFLETEGLGTDRRVGNGQFKVSWIPFSAFESLPESSHATNLSLFCPKAEEHLTVYLDAHAKYELVKRGGWMTTEPYLTFRKDSIYMFREGGIFHLKDTVAGEIVNIRPQVAFKPVEHPVWRVGKSLFLPIQLPADELE